jgi:hypothetical protein
MGSSSMMMLNDIKPQMQFTDAELAMIVQVPAGVSSSHPDAAKFNRRLFARPEPILPDPPGAQRRTRAKRGLDPDGIAARLLRLATDSPEPITWSDITAVFTSRTGVAAALQRLVVRRDLRTRELYEKATGKQWRQWTRNDRPWGALPEGVNVVDALRYLK